MNIKRSVLFGAALTTLAVGAAGAGIVSADTSSTSSGSSLVDKIATKFNLKKSDVQAVFDADRQEHQAQMEANQKQKLADAVTAGKLTQAQADHITQVMNEIKTLRGTTEPHELSADVRSQIKTKLDDLRTWATQNNVDMKYIMMGGHGGPHGHGHGHMDNDQDDASSSSTSTTTN